MDDRSPKAHKVTSRLKQRRKTFIRQWRKHRNLTQEQLCERAGMSTGNLSMLENGKYEYTQGSLEALAHALQCTPGDLLMRDPSDPDAIWSIWDTLKPAQRRMAVELLKTLKRADAAA